MSFDTRSACSHPDHTGKGGSMRPIVIICLVLVIMVAAVYMQVGNHEFSTFDDPSYVTENSHVATGITGKNIIWAFTSVHSANWHPVTWLSHMVDAQLYGMNPRGHHLTSVAIHAIATVVLFLLLYRITGARWQSSFVAALFALHPLHVESVAWVAERKDVLSGFFWFLTLFLYSEYASKRKPVLYILTLASFVLGLMAKPMLVTLPLVMLMLDYWPLGRYKSEEMGKGVGPQSGRKSVLAALVKEKIPFLLCSLLSAGVTIYAQKKVESIASLEIVPLGFRIENALIVYVTYIRKTLWPDDLAVLYPIPSSFPLWQAIGSLFIILLISFAVVWARHRRPYIAVGWFWYLVTLVPVIGIIQVGSQSMADRYTYIPHIGLFIIVAWGIPDLTAGLKYRKALLALLAGAVISASAAMTWQQLGYWRDSVYLFRRALQITPGKSIIHNSLGYALFQKGDLDAAIQEYQEALRTNPDFANTHFNLGLAHARKGNWDAAIKEYQEALRLKPNYSEAHTNLGVTLADTGNSDAAIMEYMEALKINPDDATTHNNLGIILVRKGDLDAAIQEFQATLNINPSHASAHNNIGFVFASKGELDAAIHEFQEALRINPAYAEAEKNLGIALGQKRMQHGQQ